MYNIKNKPLLVLIFSFTTIFTFFALPIFILLLLFFLSSLIKGRFSFILNVSCFISLIFILQLTINDNGYNVGDISRYYDYYDIGKNIDFIHSFQRYKIYQAYFFSYVRDYNLNITLYGAISVSLYILNVFVSSVGILKIIYKFDFCIREKVILFFSIISTVPFSIYFSFENALSVSFVYLSIYYFLSKSNVLAFSFILFSIIIHSASLPLVAIVIFARFCQIRKFDNLFIFIPCFLFMLLLFLPNVSVGIPVFDRAIISLKAYANNGFNISSLFYGLILLSSNFLVFRYVKLYLIKNNESVFYLRFLFYILCFSLPMIINATYTYRFIWFPSLFFIPALFVMINSHRFNLNIIILILLKVVLIFSYQNLLVLSAQKYITYSDGEYLILNVNEIIRFLSFG